MVAVWAAVTSKQRIRTVRDYTNWLKRLDGFAAWCDTALERMREGVAKAYVLPKALTEKVIPQLAKLAIGPAEKHPFYAPINYMPAEIKGEDRERLGSAYTEMIRRKVIPAYATLLAYVGTEYLAASRPSSGISAIPRGKEFNDLQVKAYTTTEMTPEQVHELGLKEVKRTLGEMEKVKQQVGFTGTLREFFEQ